MAKRHEGLIGAGLPPGLRRDKDGLLLVLIKEVHQTGEGAERKFQASTVGREKVAFGPTPRLAAAKLLQLLKEPAGAGFAAFGTTTAKLLRTPFKPPGADKGGQPRKRGAVASENLVVRCTPARKAELQAVARHLGLSPSEVVHDALDAYLLDHDGLRRRGLAPAATE